MALDIKYKGYKAIKIGKNHPKINFANQNIIDFSNHKLRSDFLEVKLASNVNLWLVW